MCIRLIPLPIPNHYLSWSNYVDVKFPFPCQQESNLGTNGTVHHQYFEVEARVLLACHKN